MLESSHIAFAFDFQTCFLISKSLWSGFIFSSSLAPMSRHIQRERERERTLWACRRQTQWKCSLVYVSTEPSHAINHVFVWTPIWVRSCFNNKLKMHWGAELVQKSLSINKCWKFVPFLRGFHGRNWVFFQQNFNWVWSFWKFCLWVDLFFSKSESSSQSLSQLSLGALVLLLVNNAAWNSSESECVRDLFAFSFVFWFLFPESVSEHKSINDAWYSVIGEEVFGIPSMREILENS